MTISDVLRNRDRAIKFEISGLLAKALTPQDRAKVTAQLADAFETADATWQEDLKQMVGQARAQRLLDQLDALKLG